MKCSACERTLTDQWVSIAGMMPSGSLYVANFCWPCVDIAISRPIRRRLQNLITGTGWVQDRLPSL